MNLEHMTDTQLNEVFDAGELGTLYPVQDLTPKAKVPQMLHIKVPGTDDLLVRLTHLDTVGTRVKAVQPGDKTVQVFLMSLSDKGNITDFRGGLGSDPVGAINTIFTTVLEISKKFRFEAVLFRFPKNKMKGQERAAQRILSRLIKNRSMGRFTNLEEVEREESKKFSFVLAVKKNSDFLDTVPLSDNIETIETKVGPTFIDKDTGTQISKAEAVAAEIVKKSEKIPTKSVIAKTKVSKQALIAALYGNTTTDTMSPKTLEVFNDLQVSANPPISKDGKEAKSLTYSEKSNKDRLDGIAMGFERISRVNPEHRQSNRNDTFIANDMELLLRGRFNFEQDRALSLSRYLFGRTADILFKAKPYQLNNTFKEIATAALENEEFRSLPLDARIEMISPIINYIINSMAERLNAMIQNSPWEYDTRNWSEPQRDVIKSYCDTSYDLFNGFLRGTYAPHSPEIMKEKIETMDSLFVEHGIKLKRGVLLYRAQKLTERDFVNAMENKMFYFRNYVSTSVVPIIYADANFGGMGVSATGSILADNPLKGDSADPLQIAKSVQFGDVAPEDASMNKVIYGTAKVPAISYVISGADKVKVVIPGPLATYKDEHEVILPRGVVFKYNTITGGQDESTGNSLKSILIEAEVMNPAKLQESIVYDGDLFMETGEFVAVDLHEEEVAEVIEAPMSFSAQFRKPRFEEASNQILQALASAAVSNIKPRFIN